MKKNILALVLLVVGVVGLAWYLMGSRPSNETQLPANNKTPNPPGITPSSSTEGKAAVDVWGQFINVAGKSFVSTSSGRTVTFGKEVKDDGSIHGYVEVLVDNKAVGGAQTDLQSLFSFSPNGEYFAFRTQRSYGAAAFGQALSVINLSDRAMINVKAPFTDPTEYPKAKIDARVTDISELYETIESFSWNGDSIDVTFYFVTPTRDETTRQVVYYRATPKEIWRYNLTTGQYSLVQTLP